MTNEIENLYNCIVKEAEKTNSRQVFVSHDSLAPFIDEKGWEVDPSPMNIKKRNDRIRHHLYKNLLSMGITIPNNGYSTKGYNFILSNDIPLNVHAESVESAQEFISGERIKTLSDYVNPFVPPRNFPDIKKAVEKGLRIIMVGPKGCGKSRTLEEVGASLGIPQVRIPLGITNDPADLIGTKEVVNDNGVPVTRFVNGIIAEAATNGYMVILDEFDSVQPGVALALNMIFEKKSKVVCFTEGGIHVITPHPNFRIVATANTWGFGDSTGLYSGTEVGNRSTWDRMAMRVEVDYDPRVEEQIIQKYLHPNVVKALYFRHDTPEQKAGIVIKIRESIKKDDINDHLSVRPIEDFAENFKDFGWHKGMEYFLINQFNPDYREQIRQIIRSQIGNEFIPSINDYDDSKPDYIPAMEETIKKSGPRGIGFIREE